jgi:hypothetical protein
MGLKGFLFRKINKNKNIKISKRKKILGAFKSCLLSSTANPAQFGWKWAGLDMLFSRKLPNVSHDFFHIFRIIYLNPQTGNVRAFLSPNISAIGSLNRQKNSSLFILSKTILIK